VRATGCRPVRGTPGSKQPYLLGSFDMTRSPVRRRVFVGLSVVALVATAAWIAASVLLDLDRYRPRIITYLEQQTGKPAEIGKLSLRLFPPAIHVENFGLRNAPPFPSGYIVKVAAIDAELEPHALWHRHLVVTALALDRPEVNPMSDPDGPWNFSNPTARPASKPFTLGEIGRVYIRRGQLVASNLLPS